MSLQQAKYHLLQQRSLLETALNTGLSGTGRLHDLFIQLEGMTPGEYKLQGEGVTLNYSIEASPLVSCWWSVVKRDMFYSIYRNSRQY